jgi:hypothetical protein
MTEYLEKSMADQKIYSEEQMQKNPHLRHAYSMYSDKVASDAVARESAGASCLTFGIPRVRTPSDMSNDRNRYPDRMALSSNRSEAENRADLGLNEARYEETVYGFTITKIAGIYDKLQRLNDKLKDNEGVSARSFLLPGVHESYEREYFVRRVALLMLKPKT